MQLAKWLSSRLFSTSATTSMIWINWRCRSATRKWNWKLGSRAISSFRDGRLPFWRPAVRSLEDLQRNKLSQLRGALLERFQWMRWCQAASSPRMSTTVMTKRIAMSSINRVLQPASTSAYIVSTPRARASSKKNSLINSKRSRSRRHCSRLSRANVCETRAWSIWSSRQ